MSASYGAPHFATFSVPLLLSFSLGTHFWMENLQQLNLSLFYTPPFLSFNWWFPAWKIMQLLRLKYHMIFILHIVMFKGTSTDQNCGLFIVLCNGRLVVHCSSTWLWITNVEAIVTDFHYVCAGAVFIRCVWWYTCIGTKESWDQLNCRTQATYFLEGHHTPYSERRANIFLCVTDRDSE